MQQSIKGFFFIFLSVSLLGLTPVIGKFAYRLGISVETLLFLRFAIASVLLFSYLLIRHQSFKIRQNQFRTIIVLGLLFCIQSVTYFTSIKYILSSLAVVLFYIYPIIVLLLTIFIDKQKLSLGILFPILLSLLGIIILVGLPTGSINYFGVLLTITSAFSFALYVIIGKRIVSELSTVVLTSWVTGCTSIFLLIVGTIKGSISLQFQPTGWYYVIALALFCTIISTISFYRGMKYLSPAKTSLFSTIEPIVTTISAYLLLNEAINPIQIIGIGCILSSVILVIMQDVKKVEQVKQG